MAKSYALFKKQQKLLQKQKKESKLRAKNEQYEILKTSSCASFDSNDSITYDNLLVEQCESDLSSLDEIAVSSPPFGTNSYFTNMTVEHSNEYQAFLEFINSSDNSMLHEDSSFNDDFFQDDDFNTISMEDIFDPSSADIIVQQKIQTLQLLQNFYESETDTSEDDLEKSFDSDFCPVISDFDQQDTSPLQKEEEEILNGQNPGILQQIEYQEDESQIYLDLQPYSDSDSEVSSSDDEDSFQFSNILYYNSDITVSLVPPGIFSPKKNLTPKKSSLRTIDFQDSGSSLLSQKADSTEIGESDVLQTKMAKHDIIYLMSAKNGTLRDATRYATELNSDNCIGVRFPNKLHRRIYIPTNQSRKNSNHKLTKAAIIEAKKAFRFNQSEKRDDVSELKLHLGVYSSDQLDLYLKHNGRTMPKELLNHICKKSVKWADILEW